MKLSKTKLIFSALLLFSGVSIYSVKSQTPHSKFKKIQKYIDNATEEKLAGVVIYIKSPKYGKWIGVSGYSDIENNIPMISNELQRLANMQNRPDRASFCK